MARKKILFFIVEGVSEFSALSVALEKIFESSQVVVRIAGGDITSDITTTPDNVITRIVEQIKDELGRSVKPSDFLGVVQLVDTDGVFIDPEQVVKGEKLYYDTDVIKTDRVQAIRRRNECKSKVLNKLIRTARVWRTIPYRVFFFSVNLDHVLHDISNLDDSLKEKKAYGFAKDYKNNLKGFVEFFCDNTFTVRKNYADSWEFIKKGTNSLKRYSNFNLIFKDESA